MSAALSEFRERLASAIGGRSKAGAVELRSQGRFKRLTLQSWIDGRTAPSVQDLFELAEFTGRDIGWFIGVKAPLVAGIARLSVVDAEASAGHGHINDQVVEVGQIPFPEEWLRKLGGRRPDRCDFMRVNASGDSMAPTIAPGALLLVNRDEREPPRARRKKRAAPDDIFVFRLEDELRVKRLQRLPKDHLAIISDNVDAYPVEIIVPDDAARVTVIGRVIWWDNRL